MSYAITGIPMPTHPDPQHPIPLRKEVTAWQSDPENAVQFSLFIQALIKFQQMDYTNKLSYFQVAGIHGQPATSWDGANAPGQWYCNHQKTTFPTWHRPYLLLFEQRIYEIMMSEIVSGITPASEQSIWAIEASHWRLPYWDWAADQPYLQNVGVPQLFTVPQVTVVMPNSKSATFNNPLWKFTNPKGVAMGDQSMKPWIISAQPFNIAISTSRHATVNQQTRNAFVQGVNNFNGANKSIQAHRWDSRLGSTSYAISDLVSRLLTNNYLKTWRYFSSTLHAGEGGAPAVTEYLSLEEIHNNIHSFTGGDDGTYGHMQTPSVASFDPIFFLHHCNVDKQLAMWQTLNPTKWFDNLSASDSGPTAVLAPFHKDTKSTLYTSNDCRDWTKLNYQYDDLENTPRFIRAQTQAQGKQVTGDHIAGHVRRKVNMHLNKCRQSVLSAPNLQGRDNDYLINVVYDRYGLDGRPYSLHFFLGAVPDPLPDGATYPTLDGYVGTIYTFSSNLELEGESQCESCVQQRKAGMLSKAQVILTTKLIDDALDHNNRDLEDLTPQAVERYLAKHLTWKAVEAMTGRVVPHEELQHTKVFVMAGKAQHFEDPQQDSQYTDYGHMFGATQGKPGGATQQDQGTHMEL